MIVYVTNYGTVVVISDDFKWESNHIKLPGLDEVDRQNKMVTNSFALDSKGGIFIVTSLYMNKVRWNPDLKLLSLDWSTKYHETN